MPDRCTLRPQNMLLPNPSLCRRAGSTAATLALLAAMVWAPAAVAEVNRCERGDGSVIYTDRRCSDIGAVEQLPRGRSTEGAGGRYYPVDCPRTADDLRFQMTMAIDARDVNQLANVYHWVGVSGRGAVQVMNRLEAVVQRPLVDIVMVRPQRLAVVTPEPARTALDPDGGIASGTPSDATSQPLVTPVVAREPRPVAVRVIQTLAGTSTPSETVYRLHRYFGCVWITQ